MLGSFLLGLSSDLVKSRCLVHLIGCVGGAISLSMLTTIRDQQHTPALCFLFAIFNIFENGATVVIGIILCDIGKDQITQHQLKALATISGICDGIAGFGSIVG